MITPAGRKAVHLLLCHLLDPEAPEQVIVAGLRLPAGQLGGEPGRAGRTVAANEAVEYGLALHRAGEEPTGDRGLVDEELQGALGIVGEVALIEGEPQFARHGVVSAPGQERQHPHRLCEELGTGWRQGRDRK